MAKGVEAVFLYFDSNHISKLVKATIYDGTVIIDNKMFVVDMTRPLYITFGKIFKKTYPLYIIKWNDIKPYNIARESLIREKTEENLKELKNTRQIEPIKAEQFVPEFHDYNDDMTPELAKKIADTKITAGILGGSKNMSIILIIVGALLGAIIVYFMITSGLIKVPVH